MFLIFILKHPKNVPEVSTVDFDTYCQWASTSDNTHADISSGTRSLNLGMSLPLHP